MVIPLEISCLPSGWKIKCHNHMKNTGKTIYCDVNEWLQTGFGLVIGFIDHLHIVTTSNYSANANSHTLQFNTARTRSSQSAVSSPVVAWELLPTADVPLTLGFRTIPVPQLPASNSNGSQGLNLSSSLTNRLLTNQLAPLQSTALIELNSVCRVIYS
jgi:hypothetical protein